MLISLIVPCYNEEEAMPLFLSGSGPCGGTDGKEPRRRI